mgnify:CR=1 FL=1
MLAPRTDLLAQVRSNDREQKTPGKHKRVDDCFGSLTLR